MLLAASFSVLLLGVFADIGHDPECPHGFVYWPTGKSCYLISDITATRDEAAKYCGAMGSKLVSVENENENYFLKFVAQEKFAIDQRDYEDKIMMRAAGYSSYWTSGMIKTGETKWSWQPTAGHKAEMTYSDWKNGAANATLTYYYDKKTDMWIYMEKMKEKMRHQGHSNHGMNLLSKYTSWNKKSYNKDDDDDSSSDSDEVQAEAETGQKTTGHAWGKKWGGKWGMKKQTGHGHGHRLGKRSLSLFGQDYYNQDTDETQEDATEDNVETEPETEPEAGHGRGSKWGHKKRSWGNKGSMQTKGSYGHSNSQRWGMVIPDLQGNNCTIIRSCMKTGMGWMAASCDQHFKRFFICEVPATTA